MKILVVGGDGYLGWPQAMYLSRRGHDVTVLDNLAHRRWDLECGTDSLVPIADLRVRAQAWLEISGKTIDLRLGDVTDFAMVEQTVSALKPDAIVHFGEQPSAPYSMIDRAHAVYTQLNNITGTLNLLYAIKEHRPDCHLVKLGTMGEYGTPNIDIEEGFIEISHNGRRDRLPFPKQPGSFYHLSKVHDSHNILFACRTWGLRSTDLNQGIVYGVETDEAALDARLATRFDYDAIWGTVLNRFCVQALVGGRLTVYGRGGQTRGFINIRDTMRCIELALLNPPRAGEYRVFNQFTEQFSVAALAAMVQRAAGKKGINVEIAHRENPRVEAQSHYYNARHAKLVDLGLEPHRLTEAFVESILARIEPLRPRVNPAILEPLVRWGATRNRAGYLHAKDKASIAADERFSAGAPSGAAPLHADGRVR
ncbi:MAG: NAD-dependent epimerase/dehydratase family protein [Deltaproteobacteria bacterium]|nr:NAD-dependent epimerase/dehydratase family protein [Deltaproteobacteria bacterium]